MSGALRLLMQLLLGLFCLARGALAKWVPDSDMDVNTDMDVDTVTDTAYIQLSVSMKAPTEPQQLMNAIQHLEGIKLVQRK